MSKHTPGPWAIKKSPKAEAVTDGKDWPWLVSYNDGGYEGYLAIVQTENAKANARLISAAPELLEALENLERTAGLPAMQDDPARAAARAAIAKAKGETK